MSTTVSPQGSVNAATGMFVGPVNVEFEGVFQSTWNCHTSRDWSLPLKSIRYSGEPDGGNVLPSRSAARSDPYELPTLVKHCMVADDPLSTALRLIAQAYGPS